jgi:membrane protein required for colicin V production
MSLAFTFIDVVVVAIVIVSMIFAIWRGFISETLSIFAWAAAAFATLYFGPFVAPVVSHLFSPHWLAWLVGYAGVFLFVLIPISYGSFRLSESVQRSSVGPLDRTLGAIFGIVRGLVIVGGLYILFTLFVPVREHPTPLRDAKLLPLIQRSAEFLISLAPVDTRTAAERRLEVAPARAQKAASDRDSRQETQDTHRPAAKAYGAKDRQALDKLIEATGSQSKKP